jgi:hypothetical protein
VTEERSRDDGFEATFVVRTPRTDAWERLSSAAPVSDVLPEPRTGQRWMPGFEGASDDVEVVPGHLLRTRKASFPCDGTEIVVTLEDEGTGTRITIAQFGFGPGFEQQRPWLAAGWATIVADLVVFFERGVVPGRHLTAWSSIGCEVFETACGLVVGTVAAGQLAAQVGLRPDDLLITIAGAPVTTIRDLSVLVRGPLQPGTPTAVRYLRDDRMLRGSGTV